MSRNIWSPFSKMKRSSIPPIRVGVPITGEVPGIRVPDGRVVSPEIVQILCWNVLSKYVARLRRFV